MAHVGNHLCRLCLTTTHVLRSIFTTFRNQNLVLIIKEFVRLEIKENDELPKLICTCCAVKLIRIHKNVELFLASDRKLRDQFRDGGDSSDQSDQRRKIIDPGQGPSKGGRPKSRTPIAGSTDENQFEFHDVKEEIEEFEEDLESTALVSRESLKHSLAEEEDHKLPDIRVNDSISSAEKNSSKGDSEEIDIKETNIALSIQTSEDVSNDPRRRQIKPIKTEHDTEVDFVSDDEERDATFESESFRSTSIEFEYSSSESNSAEEKQQKKVKRPGRPRRGTKEPEKGKKQPRKRRQPAEPVPTLNDHKCYICKSESLGSKQALIEHLATHLDRIPHTCTECVMETVVLTRVRVLNNHLKMHAMPIKCDYCDRRYSNPTGKTYHIQTFHLGGGEPCTVNCEVCGKTCGSQNALKAHMRYHTTKLKCSKCDMVFNHWNKLRRHEQKHGDTERFECSVCKKVLFTAESYNNHFKMHSQELSYHCHLCPKKFNTSPGLTAHLKVHAKNEKYKPARSWADHYTVLSKSPKRLKCNHCEHFTTYKATNMISHLHSHFKEFECDQCHNMFATPSLLRDHYTTHTGEKPVKCDYCEKTFSARNSLRFHLKASHPEWVPQRSGCRRTHPNQQAAVSVDNAETKAVPESFPAAVHGGPV